MNHCPSDAIRWCVISEAEKLKCESMLLAFKAKDLKPGLDCLYGYNTTTCMEMIRQGDADLINLDAGDVYVAGRYVVNYSRVAVVAMMMVVYGVKLDCEPLSL